MLVGCCDARYSCVGCGYGTAGIISGGGVDIFGLFFLLCLPCFKFIEGKMDSKLMKSVDGDDADDSY